MLTAHTTLGAHMFKLRPHTEAELPTVWWQKRRHTSYVIVWYWLAKDTEPWVICFEAQGSRKHEGEWPHKPHSQYLAWCNTLTALNWREDTMDL